MFKTKNSQIGKKNLQIVGQASKIIKLTTNYDMN